MPGRRRTALWIAGVAGLAVVAAVAVGMSVSSKGKRAKAARPALVIDEKSSLPVLVQGLRESDGRALAVLFQRVTAKPDKPLGALDDAESAQWLEVLSALRSGFPRFGAYGRASSEVVATRILDRYAIDPAPADWMKALPPVRDVLLAGLSDADLEVRVKALTEVGRLWSWLPGRTPGAAEEIALADWKDAFYPTVIRRLGDREPKSRAAAVACLGTMPVGNAAAFAIPHLDDPDGEVRKQVLSSFASRPALLTEDAVARHFYDSEPGIPEMVELILKTRGLTQDQVGLARLIHHPKPGMRVSVIPLLKNRTDIDPIVWLLQLSRDAEESVRISAVEALAGREAPEAQDRLSEMARSDQSSAVRQAAGRHVTTTAALPPLPGSSSLNPKAN